MNFSAKRSMTWLSIVVILNTMETPLLANTHPDEYIQQFVQRMNSSQIIYKDNKLVLLATPSKETLVKLATAMAFFSALGLLGLMTFLYSKGRGDGAACGLFLSLLGLPFAGCGLFIFLILLAKGKKNVPYLTLDNKGLCCYENMRVRWSKVNNLEISSEVRTDQYGWEISHTRTATFLDEYANALFKIRDDDPFLPISFDNFVALARHFIDNSREFVKLQNVNVD